MAPRDEHVVDKIFAGCLEDLPPLRNSHNKWCFSNTSYRPCNIMHTGAFLIKYLINYGYLLSLWGVLMVFNNFGYLFGVKVKFQLASMKLLLQGALRLLCKKLPTTLKTGSHQWPSFKSCLKRVGAYWRIFLHPKIGGHCQNRSDNEEKPEQKLWCGFRHNL